MADWLASMSDNSLAKAKSGGDFRQFRESFASRDDHLGRVWPLVLLFYACLLPAEVRLETSGQVFFAYRLVAFALIPVIVHAILTQRFRISLADILVFVAGAWTIVSFAVVYGYSDGIVRGGALAADLILPYLIARVSIGSLDDIRRVLVMALPGLAVAGAIMALESLSQQFILRPAAASIFGSLNSYESGLATGKLVFERDFRLGLMRAMGPFSHPILAGTILASFLPLYFNSQLRGMLVPIGIATSLMAIFSLSSATFLAFVSFGVLQSYHYLVGAVSFLSWRIFLFGAASIIAFLQVATDNGVFAYLGQFTLNPQTAYYRRLIWRYGTQSIAEHPWFGIGFAGYQRLSWMPETVDAHWLMLGIRHGLIACLALFFAAAWLLFIMARRYRQETGADRQTCFGMITALTIFIVTGFTVAFFGSLAIWFAAFLGMCASIGVSKAPFASPGHAGMDRSAEMQARMAALH